MKRLPMLATCVGKLGGEVRKKWKVLDLPTNHAGLSEIRLGAQYGWIPEALWRSSSGVLTR